MSPFFSIIADCLVAILLAATIVTSVRLSRRIAKLKSDEDAMRRTISELMIATETAERAIAGLRTTLSECDRTLADRLLTAERYAADLSAQVEAGEGVVSRITKIVESTRALETRAAPKAPEPAPVEPPASDRLSATVAAAHALAQRAAQRLAEAA